MRTVNIDKERRNLELYEGFVFAVANGRTSVDLYYREDAELIVEVISRLGNGELSDDVLEPKFWLELPDHCSRKFRLKMTLKNGGKKKGRGKLQKQYKPKYNIKQSTACYGTCPQGECRPAKGMVPGHEICKCL